MRPRLAAGFHSADEVHYLAETLRRVYVDRNNKLGDPDAIEIEANHVGKNLSCQGNSSVWDSHELSMTSNFPRGPSPNTVHGKRSGQCVLATPTTMGGPSGPGAF